jgi:chromosome segregation ATPase
MITNKLKKFVKEIFTILLFLCLSLFSAPMTPFADGNVPEEVKKTPFAPSRDLRLLKLDLKACEKWVAYDEGTRDGLDDSVKSIQKQEREEKNWIKKQKNRIKFLKKTVKDDQRTLSRGKYRNGETLSSEGRTKLERRNNETIRKLKRAEINLERGYKRLEAHQHWIRSTKSELKELRSKLKNLRAKCARIDAKIKKASG